MVTKFRHAHVNAVKTSVHRAFAASIIYVRPTSSFVNSPRRQTSLPSITDPQIDVMSVTYITQNDGADIRTGVRQKICTTLTTLVCYYAVVLLTYLFTLRSCAATTETFQVET